MTNQFQVILLVLVSTIMVVLVSCDLHNDVCSPSLHCNVSAGLVCDSNRCACTRNDLVESEISHYNLTWDATRNLCVGVNGSGCVGTRNNPVPEGMKGIECIDKHTCTQINKAPLSIGICKPAPAIFAHGGSCTPAGDSANLEFCDASLGLFCDSNNICACSNERVNTSPDYSMVWNEERGKCVGDVGSGCIGTKETPVASGLKMVECTPNTLCIQAIGQTPGVGICQRTAGNSAGKLRNDMITFGLFVLSYFTLYLFV